MLPKKACDVNRCEVARIMKLTSSGDEEPLPYIEPRKFEGYQPDVYPPSFAGIPALSAEEWRQGQNSNPILMVSLFPRFYVVAGAGRYVPHQEGRRHARFAARAAYAVRAARSVRSAVVCRACCSPDAHSASISVSRADGDVAACDVACADVQ